MAQMSPQDFTTTYGPLAEDIGKATGLDPSVVLGQAAQETGWGNHYTGNNIFGISPGGKVAEYPTIQDGAKAYVDLINGRYAVASKFPNPDQQARAITQLGYNSVDKTYADSVIGNAAKVRAMRADQSAPSTDDLVARMKTMATPGAPQPQPSDSGPTADSLVARMKTLAPAEASPPADTGAAYGVNTEPPDITPDPRVTASMGRIGSAAADAYQNTPPIFTPKMQGIVDQGPVGRFITNPLMHILGAVPAGINALGAGIAQGVNEGATAAGVPTLARDLNPLITSAQMVMGGAPGVPMTRNGLVARDGAVPAAPRFIGERTGEVTPMDTVAAPLPQAFRDNPLARGAPERIAAAPSGPTSPAPNLLAGEMPTMTVRPNVPAVQAPAEVAATAPKTAAEAKAVASAYYDKAEQAGGTLTPEFANKFVEAAKRVAPQSEAGLAVAGETPITALAKRIETLRDQPITLKAAQEIDESLGSLIDKEYGVKGLSKDGKNLVDLQSTFRDMIHNAGPEDVVGGNDGFAALSQGRRAWTQAMKMDDLERIQTRAMGTDNPATGIKSGIRTLLANRSRVRGYSDDEIAALKQAQDRGVIGGALHVFGSRLIPQAAAVGGFFGGGPIGGAIAGVTSHYAATGLRAGATKLQANRLAHALETLGRGVPPRP